MQFEAIVLAGAVITIGLSISRRAGRESRPTPLLAIHRVIFFAGVILVAIGLMAYTTSNEVDSFDSIDTLYLTTIPAIFLGLLMMLTGSILKRLPRHLDANSDKAHGMRSEQKQDTDAPLRQ